MMGEQIVFFFGIVFIAFLALYFGVPMVVGSWQFWVSLVQGIRRIHAERKEKRDA